MVNGSVWQGIVFSFDYGTVLLIGMIPLLERMPAFPLLHYAALRHTDAVASAVLDGVHHFIRTLDDVTWC